MPERPSDEYFAALELRLRALEPLVAQLPKNPEYTNKSLDDYSNYLDVGEYALAIEVVSEQLTPEMLPEIVGPLATDFYAEAKAMSMSESLLLHLWDLAGRPPMSSTKVDPGDLEKHLL